MASANRVFISYARHAEPFVRLLTDELEGRGVHTGRTADLAPGDNWRQTIEQSIRDAGSVLLLVDSTHPYSRLQDFEWRSALDQSWSDTDKRLVPVMIGDGEVPPFLRTHHVVRIHPDSHPREAVTHVIEALNAPQEKPGASPIPERLERLAGIESWAKQLAEEESAASLPPGA